MASPRRRNVVIVFTDQQRWDTLGCLGNPMGLTPTLDRFARMGTLCQYAFTPNPLCAPARAALQTGAYPTMTGVFKNGMVMPSDAATVANCFAAEGYRTGYIGKWHLAPPLAQEAVAPEYRGGYSFWLGANALEFCSDAYDTVMYDNEMREVRLPGYRVDAITDAGIKFIAENRDNPFFLFLSYLEPHHQNARDEFTAPEGYRDAYTNYWWPPDLAALKGNATESLPGYYGMVKRIDEAVGRLGDALKSLQLEDDTIVLFTSDHGCHFRTRNDEYKRSCHESSIRIPMIWWGPGFNSGGVRRELISLIDVAPTLLDSCGIRVPDVMQGRSLYGLLQGRDLEWRDELLVQISETELGRALRTSRWKYHVISPGGDGSSEATARRFVEHELYDLDADPWELRNLISDATHDHVRSTLRASLLSAIREVGDDCVEIVGPS